MNTQYSNTHTILHTISKFPGCDSSHCEVLFLSRITKFYICLWSATVLHIARKTRARELLNFFIVGESEPESREAPLRRLQSSTVEPRAHRRRSNYRWCLSAHSRRASTSLDAKHGTYLSQTSCQPLLLQNVKTVVVHTPFPVSSLKRFVISSHV